MLEWFRAGTCAFARVVWQVRSAAVRLSTFGADFQVELGFVSTRGDRALGRLLERVGASRIFVAEAPEPLLDPVADRAAYGLKNLEMGPGDGLTIGAVSASALVVDAPVARVRGFAGGRA